MDSRPAKGSTLHRVQHFLPTPPYTPEPSLNSSPPKDESKRLSIEGSSRLLSENELSYYLPSRADGVNDMYLHHRLNVPAHFMAKDRLLHLWAYQLLRHPLLAARLESSSYEQVRFVNAAPRSLSEALSVASRLFTYVASGGDIMSTYLNGPRTLANDRLAMLFVTSPEDPQDEYEVMLCATHFLGDGMALHTFMNELYTLVGSDKSVADLQHMIKDELDAALDLPASLEERLPSVGNGSKFAAAVGAEEYRRNEAKLVGGQGFPSNSAKMERHTVVPTFAYSAEETKKILAACKGKGVTIAHAMFALCNIAWSRRASNTIAPCLIYSALNLRPNMSPASPSTPPSSFFHLAVGYFNIVLPTLLPSIPIADLFWHRARLTKLQTVRAVKSPFVVARSRETSKVRAARAIKWARIDDEAAKPALKGLGLGITVPNRPAPTPDFATPGPKFAPLRAAINTPDPTPVIPQSAASSAPAISQKALMGVSMLGNLDGMYKHAAYPDITLKSLTTGSRQRPGGLLLFAYTFAGKLWFSLGYDENGFEPGVIEGFWEDVQSLVREVLL